MLHPPVWVRLCMCLWICAAGFAGCKKKNPVATEPDLSLVPEAPAGYRWRSVSHLSDEFAAGRLDASKWIDFHPYWNGREPSRFDPRNVSVEGGILRLLSVPLVDDLAAVRDPEKDVWVGSACVSSRTASASYGYYEARVQASDLSMTSSFWFQGKTIVCRAGNRHIFILKNLKRVAAASSGRKACLPPFVRRSNIFEYRCNRIRRH